MTTTFIGAADANPTSGSNVLTVPVGVQAGDLFVINALGRSANFGVPTATGMTFNVLQTGSGAGESSFTYATVSWGICPATVPATITCGSASFNSMSSMVVYRAGAGETFLFDGVASLAGVNGGNITPGDITATSAGLVLMCPASNSGNNVEIVIFGGASYTARSNTTTNGRIATSIFEYEVPVGTTALPTVTLSRTEPRGFYAVVIYAAAVFGAWSYATSTFTNGYGQAAAVGDKIYLLGGYYIGTTAHRMYDTTLDTITSKPSAPISITDQCSACAAGGLVYAHQGSGTSLYVYDPATNEWGYLSDSTYSTTTAWMVADGLGNLWLAGGSGNASTTPLMKYTIATNTWSLPGTTVSNGSQKRAALGADGIIYSFGGYDGSYQPAVQKLNPATGVVTTGTAMPGGRSTGAVGSNGSLIYYAGGEGVSGTSQSNHWAFNTETATWSIKPPMNIGSFYSQYASVGKRFYVVGGIAAGIYSGTIQIWYDPEVNGGVLVSTGVALTSLYAEGYGEPVGVANAVLGEADVTFRGGVQVDSFFDSGSTGSVTFD